MIKGVLILLTAFHLNAKTWGSTENNLIKLITDLNENLNIQWNLIITEPSNDKKERIEALLKIADKSMVILTANEIGYKAIEAEDSSGLHARFGYNVMTIVYWNGKYGKENLLRIFDFLRKTLKFMHFTPLLWILEDGSVMDLDLFDISQLAFENGFVKVLYSLPMDLYTYRPLPFMQIQKLSSLNDFYERRDITNFHQYPVTFPIIYSPPRCYRYRNANGNWIVAGYFCQILRLFMQHYNFKFMEYPHGYNNEDRDDLLQLLALQKVDLLPLKIYRKRTLAASDVLWNLRIIMAVPNAKPIQEFKYFERPLKNTVWLFHMAVIVIITMSMGFISYYKTKQMDFSNTFLYVLATAIYQSHVQLKKSPCLAKCLDLVLVVYGFIMVQMYLCKLSSLLALTIYEPQLETLSDINSTDLKTFGYIEDIQHIMRYSNISPIIIERTILVDGADMDNIRRSLNTSYFHLGFEDKFDFFMAQQKRLKVPLLRKVYAVFAVDPIFFAMRHNLPYIQLFNRYLKYIAASGLLNKIMHELEREGILSGEIQYFEDRGSNSELFLTLTYFRSPLILYFMGISLSVCVFILEILYFKFKLHRQRKKSYAKSKHTNTDHMKTIKNKY